MATKDHPNLAWEKVFTREVGNAYRRRVTFDRSAFAENDKERLMKLPVGMVIDLIEVHVYDVHAGVTVDIGTTDDEDRFFDGQSIAAQGVFDSRAVNNHAPFKVTKANQHLMLTVLGAAIAASTKFTVTLIGTYEGTP